MFAVLTNETIIHFINNLKSIIMGQYYKPSVLNEDKTQVLAATCPLDWNSGMKLMEHSYYGVGVVRAAVELLKDKFKGHRFVWAGDYADDTIGDKNVYGVPCIEDFTSLLDVEKTPSPYGDGDIYHLPEEYGQAKYLLNYDKKLAVELGFEDDYDWNIHPLPLLTAESNGRGGGDYWGDEIELVGSWAYDHIGAADEMPEDFKVLEVDFRE